MPASLATWQFNDVKLTQGYKITLYPQENNLPQGKIAGGHDKFIFGINRANPAIRGSTYLHFW